MFPHFNSDFQGDCLEELSGRGAVFTAKSWRGKRRQLSFLGRSGDGGCEDDLDTEMVSGKSNVQDGELPSSTISAKKLKPHKKIFEGSYGVNRASIPRKLRSGVIKKRTCQTKLEHMPNSKDQVNGLQTTTGKDCTRNPKSGVFNPEQLSKDEEEVAEALFALAGMVHPKVTSFKNKSDDVSQPEREMHSKKPNYSLLSSQGPQAPEDAAEDTCNQTSEDLSILKREVNDLGKSTSLSQSKLSQTILQLNHQGLAKTGSGNKKTAFEQREALLSQSFYGNNYVVPTTGDLASEDKHTHASAESKKNGSTLLTSLFSHNSHGYVGDHGFPSESSATKLPYWLKTVASSYGPGLHQSHVSHKIESEVEKRKWIKNRCATHVHISHFIDLSQKPEGKVISVPESRQCRPLEGAKIKFQKASSHLNPVSNESTAVVPDSQMCSSFAEKNIADASNVPRRSSHEQEWASLAPGNLASRKQCFDFLSLSSGGCGSRNRIELDALAGLAVPQLQPLKQYNSVASLPLPPNLAQLDAYQNLNQRSTSGQAQISQAHLQLPPYFSRSNQQQHPIWMTHLGAQYRSGSMASSQIAQWQNPRQAQIPSSMSCLAPGGGGGHFPKYMQMPQQQQQFARLSVPFPTSPANSPVPIFCEKKES